MSKLIKLSESHYIIVDDSEIKEGDYLFINDEDIMQMKSSYDNDISNEDIWVGDSLNGYATYKDNCKKTTHSTKPLEPIHSAIQYQGYEYIPLSEIEEAINGYSVEKMADEILNNIQ